MIDVYSRVFITAISQANNKTAMAMILTAYEMYIRGEM